ncbi:hypothetical protein RUND412_007018 [Rhizina undulata]
MQIEPTNAYISESRPAVEHKFKKLPPLRDICKILEGDKEKFAASGKTLMVGLAFGNRGLLLEEDMVRFGKVISDLILNAFEIEGIERNSRKHFYVHFETSKKADAAAYLLGTMMFQRTDSRTSTLLPAEPIIISKLQLQPTEATLRVHCPLAISDDEFKKALRQHLSYDGTMALRRCKVGVYPTNVMLVRIHGKVNYPSDETNPAHLSKIPVSGRTVRYEIQRNFCFECLSSEHGAFYHYEENDEMDEDDDVTVKSEELTSDEFESSEEEDDSD